MTFDQRFKVFCQNFFNVENSGTPGALPHQKVLRPVLFCIFCIGLTSSSFPTIGQLILFNAISQGQLYRIECQAKMLLICTMVNVSKAAGQN